VYVVLLSGQVTAELPVRPENYFIAVFGQELWIVAAPALL
jgi:type IV secretory pathway TrbD component